MTEAIYLEVAEKAENAHKARRQVSVSGMLKYLGVSRSGYHAWMKRVPSNTAKRREAAGMTACLVSISLQKIRISYTIINHQINHAAYME